MQEKAEASQDEAEEGDGTAVEEGAPLVNFDETRYILKKIMVSIVIGLKGLHDMNSKWREQWYKKSHTH